jgi:CHASE3 domain sensor protein
MPNAVSSGFKALNRGATNAIRNAFQMSSNEPEGFVTYTVAKQTNALRAYELITASVLLFIFTP